MLYKLSTTLSSIQTAGGGNSPVLSRNSKSLCPISCTESPQSSFHATPPISSTQTTPPTTPPVSSSQITPPKTTPVSSSTQTTLPVSSTQTSPSVFSSQQTNTPVSSTQTTLPVSSSQQTTPPVSSTQTNPPVSTSQQTNTPFSASQTAGGGNPPVLSCTSKPLRPVSLTESRVHSHWTDLAGKKGVDRSAIKACFYAGSTAQRMNSMQKRQRHNRLVCVQNRRDNAHGRAEILHNLRAKAVCKAKCTIKGATVRNLRRVPFEYMMGLIKKAKGYRKQTALEPLLPCIAERFVSFSVPLVIRKTEPVQPQGILHNPLPQFGSGYETDEKGRRIRFSHRFRN